MKRRNFLKGTAAAGAAALMPAGVLNLATGCDTDAAAGWGFDTVIDRSGTWSIKQRRAEGGKLAMWVADMDFKTDPAVSAALRERLDRDVMGYTYTPDEYADIVADWLRTQHGYEVDRSWIHPCPGVISSINQAYLTFTEPGDKIIVQMPVYDPFWRFARRLGRQVVENPLVWKEDHYEMDFDGLERLFDERTKALVLCNPHNPIGILWDRAMLERLAGICERHGVVVFSDEIHADLALYGRRQIPFCSVSPAAARVGLVFGSPTKAFNVAGISNTAWCVIPDAAKRERYLTTLRNVKLDEPSIPSLIAVMSAYAHEPQWLESLKRYLEGNIETVETFFRDNPCGIRVHRPAASFLIWMDCRELGLPQPELVALFNDKARVVINDGTTYGTGGEGFIRFNIGCPRSIVEEACHRILDTIRKEI